MEPFVSSKEVAKELGIQQQRLLLWARKGLIPYYRVGAKHSAPILFKLSEVEECLKSVHRVPKLG